VFRHGLSGDERAERPRLSGQLAIAEQYFSLNMRSYGELKRLAWSGMNIVEPIFAQCRNKPSELALCAPGSAFNLVSYARLQRSVDNICRRLVSAGIAARSRVGVIIDDPVFHAMFLIALTRVGVITVSARGANVSWPIKLDGVVSDRPLQSPAGKAVLVDPAWSTGDDKPLAEKHIYRADPGDLCRIVITRASGGQQTTAIALTHGMIAARLDRQKLFLGPRSPFCDRTHLDLSLATALGLQVMLGTLWRGGALLMTWELRKTLAALAAYKIQNMVASPQNLLKFADALQTSPGYRSELVAVFSSGSLRPGLAEWIRAFLCSNLTIGYVPNDRTMVASMPAQFASQIPGAAGYVLPGVTVEIVDDEDRALPPAREGNLRLRSDYGVTEYFDDPTETQRAFRNGWFYPGDRGQLTSENVLVISSSQQTAVTA
jgi:non-ribosomal peptide synthetase component E (peptide arylation enzyme)